MLALKLGNSLSGLGKTGNNIFSLSFNGTDESVTLPSGFNSDISTSASSIWHG